MIDAETGLDQGFMLEVAPTFGPRMTAVQLDSGCAELIAALARAGRFGVAAEVCRRRLAAVLDWPAGVGASIVAQCSAIRALASTETKAPARDGAARLDAAWRDVGTSAAQQAVLKGLPLCSDERSGVVRTVDAEGLGPEAFAATHLAAGHPVLLSRRSAGVDEWPIARLARNVSAFLDAFGELPVRYGPLPATDEVIGVDFTASSEPGGVVDGAAGPYGDTHTLRGDTLSGFWRSVMTPAAGDEPERRHVFQSIHRDPQVPHGSAAAAALFGMASRRGIARLHPAWLTGRAGGLCGVARKCIVHIRRVAAWHGRAMRRRTVRWGCQPHFGAPDWTSEQWELSAPAYGGLECGGVRGEAVVSVATNAWRTPRDPRADVL